MPTKPPKPCARPGCRTLARERYCPAHAGSERQRANSAKDRNRKHDHLYDNRWRQCRDIYLRSNPLCVMCNAKGKLTIGNVIDHIKPHDGDMTLFWDSTNWQTLCRPCHARKSASEDGGFGNRKRDMGGG